MMHPAIRPNALWNSLEIAKLAISIMTPFVIAFLGYLIWDAQQIIIQQREIIVKNEQRASDARSKADDSLRQLRIGVYNSAAPLIREVLTYHFHVGNWKEQTPADIVKIKRRLDEIVYGRDAIFSSSFANSYHNFMRAAFASAKGWRGESRIRSTSDCRPPTEQNTADWERWFTKEDNRLSLCNAYKELQRQWTTELELPVVSGNRPRECPPFYDLATCS